MKSFTSFASPLLNQRTLNVINGALPSKSSFKQGGEIYAGKNNLTNFPSKIVTVYGNLLDKCENKGTEEIKSLFQEVKNNGGEKDIIEHTKNVWNLTYPDKAIKNV